MGLDSGSEAPINILTEAFLVGNDRDELRVLCMEVNASSESPNIWEAGVLDGTWRCSVESA